MEDQTLNPLRVSTAGRPAARQQTAPESVTQAAPPARWTRELPICLLLISIICVAYCGVWRFDFVYFDDPGYVKDNLDVKRGLPLFKDPKVFNENVKWAFTAFVQSNWHPLTWLSHMLDVQIYGLKAGGHHVTNIIFHVFNTLLLFWLLRRMTGRSWCSAAVAAMFAVHPMHVESVVWVAERKDVLSTFFGLVTLLVYVRYSRVADLANDTLVVLGVLSAFTWLLTLFCFISVRDGQPETFNAALLWIYIPIFAAVGVHAVATGRYHLLLYCSVFVLYAVDLLAKPMLVTLPCVCLLLDVWPLRRFAVANRASRPPASSSERPTVVRRKPKRNQRLPVVKPVAPAGRSWSRSFGRQAFLLLFEKVPLLALSAGAAIITPFAQHHGGSVASTSELSISFRIQNAMQSYAGYIGRMFWPGKMIPLHLLVMDDKGHPYVDMRVLAVATVVVMLLTGVAIVAFIHGRRYLTFGWFWYVGTLVPVIGFVQVGEQSMADRYTYLPYIGLFVAIVWAVADLCEEFAFVRRLTPGVALATAVVLASWMSWTNYQIQTWRDVQSQLLHALDVEPDNWNMLNNYGVWLWKEAQEDDLKAAKAEADGNVEEAKEWREKAVAMKNDAKSQWMHGIATRPGATDIHSNLGFAYQEEKNLDAAERHLEAAVRLKPISPRPHNNLGRLFLCRSDNCEAEVREAQAKGKSNPEAEANAKKFRQAAIEELEKAVKLDDTLLEARLNLGQVYISLNELDKAEFQYNEILKLNSENEKDRETINNFSQACLGLARLAIIRKNSDAAIKFLDKSLEIARRNSSMDLDPQTMNLLQMLADQHFQRGERRAAEKCLWPLLARLSVQQRRNVAEHLGKQCEDLGKQKEAVQAWGFMAWALATSPDPHILDPPAAMILAQRVVERTNKQDPASLDTLAAAQAANGQFNMAAQTAQAAIDLADSLGNKPLAAAVRQRLPLYQQGKPYRCDPSGIDRP